MELKRALIIIVAGVLILTTIIGISETAATLAKVFPLCLFTVIAGVIFVLRMENTPVQLLGIVMVLSPIWMVTVFDLAVKAILG